MACGWAEEVREEARPVWTFKLPRGGGLDGVLKRRDGGVIERGLSINGHAVAIRVGQPSADRVVFGARSSDGDAARAAIAQMRRALGVDVDLRPFYERYRSDPLIGPSVRSRPHLRPNGRPVAFEALCWAICEQLIEYVRAAQIERKITYRFGTRISSWDGTGALWVPPDAETVAGLAPAELEALDLAPSRAISMVRAAREVARGRVVLDGDAVPEDGWRRLRAIGGIGSWTVAVLGLHGQQRYDQLPAGDLAYLKFVGRYLRPEQGPSARADEAEVRAFFGRYEQDGWAGLAGLHALGVKASGGGAGVRFAA